MATTLTPHGVAKMLQWAFVEVLDDPEDAMFELVDTLNSAVMQSCLDESVADRKLNRTEKRYKDFADALADELDGLATELELNEDEND